MARTCGLCEHCMRRGYTVAATVVDHVVPLALGGSDDDDNTRNLCDACHLAVTREQFGHVLTNRGVDRTGRPTSLDHPWNRATPGGGS